MEARLKNPLTILVGHGNTFLHVSRCPRGFELATGGAACRIVAARYQGVPFSVAGVLRIPVAPRWGGSIGRPVQLIIRSALAGL
jgi:hypothetical protein